MGMTTGSASRTSRDGLVEMGTLGFWAHGGGGAVSKFFCCSVFLFMLILASFVKFCFEVQQRLEFYISIQLLYLKSDSTGFLFLNESIQRPQEWQKISG